jgi:hypothetical protein
MPRCPCLLLCLVNGVRYLASLPLVYPLDRSIGHATGTFDHALPNILNGF